ncbi:type III pantothenate kinase [Candidatus Berkiella aquae]|uniref:Type III pantothenate kinase n=1 Tax=Candidatus Berkiella aquae TaxID=295108 RepID=A0A0Q9YKG8_9GAMM|nr:type III pantothenate kinase [Candidatus Berkiella aquae]MCS5711228.1 type III pantothenate kinase [Candidatus Berkiella aquae]
MLLCLDIGNSHIYGGIFQGEQLSFQFRYPSTNRCTSDELGLFLKTYLREMQIPIEQIAAVAYCSVVPSLDYSVRSAFVKYFSKEPFVLQAGVKTGLQIKYKNPTEVGADRIANAIAAHHLFPQKNIIIVDLGTATNFEVISANGSFLGGAIMPGLQMQMRALNEHTANLPPVRIVKTTTALGQTTTANIQAGLYYGHRGAIREILAAISLEMFPDSPPIVVGTGGFSQLFENDQLFDAIFSDLVLQGLRIAYLKNH